MKENGGSWNIYYICRDYLGSITHVVNAAGSLTQELSYDPWGRLRNPSTQVAYAPDTEPVLFLGRGYTGHEHLTQFGLINMNARLYDPALGRFLSPDPYVQAPDFSQSFNRYSYCVNNPLRYSDPSGELFWFFPHISWNKGSGLSIGFTFVIGLPGLVSVQFGGGYNFKSGGYGFVGASAMFNSVSLSYSASGGWNVGYSAGLSIQNGFPIGTNLATVGVNYSLNHGSLSGNFSAFNIDSRGVTFDPSFSAMLFPEHFTNLIKGGGFRSNESVFERIMSGKFNSNNAWCPQQKALDYFGFEGDYYPSITSNNYQALNYYGATNLSTGHIFYGNLAFKDFATLYATYYKELYTSHKIHMRGEISKLPKEFRELGIDTYAEEIEGYMYAYKNQGLYSNHHMPFQGVEYYQFQLKLFGISYPNYPNKFQWLYKIPRKW